MPVHNIKQINRRGFLKSSLLVLGSTVLAKFLKADRLIGALAQSPAKRIYIAPDDHTDYFWSAGEATYRAAFLEMIDYYLNLADSTQGNRIEHQSRWNCDGSFWLWTYEKNRTQTQFQRLISRIRDGHISAPLNALVVCLGGAPAEAVLRGMYYAGKIERRENIRFSMAISMENQTLPYGLASLWAGAGARYSWKGICGCDSVLQSSWDREHDIYWWQGSDGSRILMKWNSMLQGNQYPGGYAEARYPGQSVDYVDSSPDFIARYPYPVIGIFGKGWDDLKTMTNEFVTTAQTKTDSTRLVIVSNEEDFFNDFEANYATQIPTISASFGNEWDLYCAALAEVSASIKRSVENLRSAEALATLVSLNNPTFMDSRITARDQAWMDLGLFWEHNFGMVGPPSGLTQERITWQRRLAAEVKSYTDTLRSDAIAAIGGQIQKSGTNTRFFVFNPLNWTRTDYADFPYAGATPLHVIDLTTGLETPSQVLFRDTQQFVRILASDVPSVGYKVFEIRSSAGQAFSNAATVNGSDIENEFYKVTVSPRGAITSWLDKTRSNRQLVRTINSRTINDLGSSTGTLQVENVGAVTVTLLATASSPLAHTSRITFIRNSNRIEIRNDINQNFDATHAWGFGFELNAPEVWHEEVGAVIKARLTSQGGHYSDRTANTRYDWLTLNHFADMNDGQVGVTLSNADCYFMRLGNSSVSTLDTVTPQISVLVGGREVGVGGGLPDQGGDNHFLQRFALCTHGAYSHVSSMKFALEHQNPLATGLVTGGSTYPQSSYSFLSIDNPSIILWALKLHEDSLGNSVVTRLWNLSENQASFKLSLSPGSILSALRLTHIETPLASATIVGGALSETITGSQLRTYALSLNQVLPTPVPTPTQVAPPASGCTSDYCTYIPMVRK